MNDPTLTPDDPKLTAYALGELAGDERAHVEAALRGDPELRAAVEDIRATAAQIEAALAAEARDDAEAADATLAVNGHRFDAHDGDAAPAEVAAAPGDPGREPGERDGGTYRSPRRARVLQFPQLYVVLATAAAAGVAIFVGLHIDERVTRQQLAETQARIAARLREAEARAAARVASVEYDLPATPVTEPPKNETASPVVARASDATGAEPARPPAAESKLALLEISKPGAMPAAAATSATAVPALAPVMEIAAPAAAPTAAMPGGAPGSLLAETTTSARPKRAEPAPSKVASAAPISGGVSAANAFDPSHPARPAGDDIVLLDAFEVTADRLPDILGIGSFSTLTTLTRGMPEPAPLPRAPRGAQFGRARDIAAFVPENDFVRAAAAPGSRFAVDVGTASYAAIRRLIEQGVRPPREAVRIEELINSFPYGYAAPKNAQAFAASLEIAAAPWAPEHRLLRVGLRARDEASLRRAPANLVFLLDVSAAMAEPGKLPLVRETLRKLVARLRPDDRVAIVTFAAEAVIALPSTPVARAAEIQGALQALTAGGPAEGRGALQLAYRVAVANFVRQGANRVFLCTDGAFDAGEREVLRLIDEKTRSGIALSVVGFGSAHEVRTPLERLALEAGAAYGYVDSRREAEKLLVEEVSRSLAVVARDVKVEVEFNPAKVLAYRLIGYENRPLRREDYAEDAGAVGEVGAGQTVTALYEIVPAAPGDAAAAAAAQADVVRYGSADAVSSRLEMPDTRRPPGPELVTVSVRYRQPGSLIGWPRTQEFAASDGGGAFAEASDDFRFAAAVAEFGMILRGSPHKGTGTMRDVIAWANSAIGVGDEVRSQRRDFIALARRTQALLR